MSSVLYVSNSFKGPALPCMSSDIGATAERFPGWFRVVVFIEGRRANLGVGLLLEIYNLQLWLFDATPLFLKDPKRNV